MNMRQKKKRCKRNIARYAGAFFGSRVRTKHLHLLGPKSRNGYLYNHNGYSIRVTAYEKEEQENTAQSADMPNEAAGDELQTAVSGI